VAHVDDVIAQALARKPVAIEWVEPADTPVVTESDAAATASLPH
jgi:ATP-dependent Lon protease